jgi:hypothetical protein
MKEWERGEGNEGSLILFRAVPMEVSSCRFQERKRAINVL